jgi:hypothetical protein
MDFFLYCINVFTDNGGIWCGSVSQNVTKNSTVQPHLAIIKPSLHNAIVDFFMHSVNLFTDFAEIRYWRLSLKIAGKLNYSGFWTCPSSGIPKHTTFRKLELFLASGEGVGDTHFVRSIRKRVVTEVISYYS